MQDGVDPGGEDFGGDEPDAALVGVARVNPALLRAALLADFDRRQRHVRTAREIAAVADGLGTTGQELNHQGHVDRHIRWRGGSRIRGRI